MSESMRVLLIDDDPVFAATLARALGRRSIDTALAHDADAALEQAVRWQPSHVLLDLNLGGDVSGLDLIAPLCERVADVRITVLTGYASIATTVTAMQRGAVGYLAKPVDEFGLDLRKFSAGGVIIPQRVDSSTFNFNLIVIKFERERIFGKRPQNTLDTAKR